MIEVTCVSVINGWQTAVKDTGYTFGPAFQSVTDLWKWQKEVLFSGQQNKNG